MIRFEKLLLLIIGIVALSSCVPKGTQTDADCGSGLFDSKSRSCITANLIPVGTLNQITIDEDSINNIITLDYDDGNGEFALSCSVTQVDVELLFTPCLCSGGICQTTVTPTTDSQGTYGFTYTITDTDGTSQTKAVRVIVTNIDDAPISDAINTLGALPVLDLDGAGPGVVVGPAIYEDQIYVAQLYHTDIDSIGPPESCAVTATSNLDASVSLPASCSCNAVGCFLSVQGTANYSGAASFDFTVTKDGLTSFAQNVAFTIVPVNDNPVSAGNEAFAVDEDNILNFTVTGGTDVEMNALRYNVVTLPSNGTLTNCMYDPAIPGLVAGSTANDDLTCTYTPAANFYGTDTIQYQIDDLQSQNNLSVVTTITITVNPINDAPTVTAIPDYVDTNMNGVADIVDVNGNGIAEQPTVAGESGELTGLEDVVRPIAAFTIDEGGGVYEDGQELCIEAINDAVNGNTVVLPDANIAIYYNGILQTTACNIVGKTGILIPNTVADAGASPVTLQLTPAAEQSTSNAMLSDPLQLNLTISDNGGGVAPNVDQLVDTFLVDFLEVDDTPTISNTGNQMSNEAQSASGGYTVTGIGIDEGGAANEDNQTMRIRVNSSNKLVVPLINIDVYYDTNGNGLAESSEYIGTAEGAVNDSTPEWIAVGDAAASANANSVILKWATTGNGSTMISLIVDDDLTDNDNLSAAPAECTGITDTAPGEAIDCFDVTVNAVGAIHGGWKNIMAVGDRVVCNDRSDCTNALNLSYLKNAANEDIKRYVKLEWNDFSIVGTGETIIGYNVFRRKWGEAFDLTNPLNETMLPTSTKEWIDTEDLAATNNDDNVAANQVYYYIVLPVDSANNLNIGTNEIFSQVRVLVPDNNMVFVHRWMVNQEVCSKMNSATQPDNHFRCEYQGPGQYEDIDVNDEYYYDIGQDMLVDVNEAGCPYSGPIQAGGDCGPNGCIGRGTGASNGFTPTAGLVYYDRESGVCYVGSGATWDIFTAINLSTTIANQSRHPGLPPMTNFTQAIAYEGCDNRGAVAAAGVPGLQANLTSRLPTRKEQIAMFSWDEDKSDADINTLETGASLLSSSKCNSNNASGVEARFTDSDFPFVVNLDAITGTQSSGIRSFITGSTLTENCVSKFGLQDHVGNVAEYSVDQLLCADDFSCSGVTSNVGFPINNFTTPDDTNFVNYALDGVRGPCNDTDASGGLCDAADGSLDEWYFYEEKYNSGRFFLPMGLVAHSNYPSDFPSLPGIPTVADYMLEIGPTSGITINQLHNDYFSVNNQIINAGASDRGAIVSGGHYSDGDKAGRYTFSLKSTEATIPAAAADLSITAGAITLTFTSKVAGEGGNSIVINLVTGTPLGISYSGTDVTLTLPAGTTDTDLNAQQAAFSAANPLVNITSTATATVLPTGQSFTLFGGFDTYSVDSTLGYRCLYSIPEASYEVDAEYPYQGINPTYGP